MQDMAQNSNTSCHIIDMRGFNIPPPLYTETAMEILDETYMNEDPPPTYEVSVQASSSNSESSQETENIINVETND